MLNIQKLVEERDYHLEWRHLWTGRHEARGRFFDLHVCRLIDGGQLRIYVYVHGEFTAYIFDPAHDASCDLGSETEKINVQDLISSAIVDIESNSFDMY